MAAQHMVHLRGRGQNASAADASGNARRGHSHGGPSRRGSKGKKTSNLVRSAAASYITTASMTAVSSRAFTADGALTPAAETWLTRAVTVQRPVVMANLRRMRKAHPTLNNRQLGDQLQKEFTRTMTGGGALIGATSVVPGVGTVASVGLSTLATGTFLEMCALYAQSMAELSGISTQDPQKAKLLVMGVMLGDEGRQLLGELSQQVSGKGRGPIASLVSGSSAASGAAGTSTMGALVANQIKRRFLRRFLVRSGTSALGRAVPFGIGAVIGGLGNRALAKQIGRTARESFGELPEETPASLVEDFSRGLQREKLRADRRERRQQKRSLRSAARKRTKDQDALPAVHKELE